MCVCVDGRRFGLRFQKIRRGSLPRTSRPSLAIVSLLSVRLELGSRVELGALLGTAAGALRLAACMMALNLPAVLFSRGGFM